MIFAEADHVQQIIDGAKTQTRRASDRYKVGRTYAVQPCRTCKGIPEGRILITQRWLETWLHRGMLYSLSSNDAEAEGGYTPEEYEGLYSKMHPDWKMRWAYDFKFVPSEEAR